MAYINIIHISTLQSYDGWVIFAQFQRLVYQSPSWHRDCPCKNKKVGWMGRDHAKSILEDDHTIYDRPIS